MELLICSSQNAVESLILSTCPYQHSSHNFIIKKAMDFLNFICSFFSARPFSTYPDFVQFLNPSTTDILGQMVLCGGAVLCPAVSLTSTHLMPVYTPAVVRTSPDIVTHPLWEGRGHLQSSSGIIDLGTMLLIFSTNKTLVSFQV